MHHTNFGSYDSHQGFEVGGGGFGAENDDVVFKDKRLDRLDAGIFHGARVLDIGCNAGYVSISLGENFSPSFVLGVDIDGKLIKKARRLLADRASVVLALRGNDHISSFEQGAESDLSSTEEENIPDQGTDGSVSQGRVVIERDQQSSHSCDNVLDYENKNELSEKSLGKESPVDSNNKTTKNDPDAPVGTFPISLPIAHGVLRTALYSSRTNRLRGFRESVHKFPRNIVFRRENILEALEQGNHPFGGYDVILCWRITKWIHLMYGDQGVQKLFTGLKEILAPGGKLVLQAQPWNSYKSKRFACEAFRRNYPRIVLKPELFPTFLLQRLHFHSVRRVPIDVKVSRRRSVSGSKAGADNEDEGMDLTNSMLVFTKTVHNPNDQPVLPTGVNVSRASLSRPAHCVSNSIASRTMSLATSRSPSRIVKRLRSTSHTSINSGISSIVDQTPHGSDEESADQMTREEVPGLKTRAQTNKRRRLPSTVSASVSRTGEADEVSVHSHISSDAESFTIQEHEEIESGFGTVTQLGFYAKSTSSDALDHTVETGQGQNGRWGGSSGSLVRAPKISSGQLQRSLRLPSKTMSHSPRRNLSRRYSYSSSLSSSRSSHSSGSSRSSNSYSSHCSRSPVSPSYSHSRSSTRSPQVAVRPQATLGRPATVATRNINPDQTEVIPGLDHRTKPNNKPSSGATSTNQSNIGRGRGRRLRTQFGV